MWVPLRMGGGKEIIETKQKVLDGFCTEKHIHIDSEKKKKKKGVSSKKEAMAMQSA